MHAPLPNENQNSIRLQQPPYSELSWFIFIENWEIDILTGSTEVMICWFMGDTIKTAIEGVANFKQLINIRDEPTRSGKVFVKLVATIKNISLSFQ